MEQEVQIHKEDFQEYEDIRVSGDYNMFDSRAREMTDLSKEQWIDIMKNYPKYKEMYQS